VWLGIGIAALNNPSIFKSQKGSHISCL